jgi:hypothetical protein
MDIDNIKVKMFKCRCGKARMLSVISPEGKPFSKDTVKEHKLLFNAGCDVTTISLTDARKMELCFTCVL